MDNQPKQGKQRFPDHFYNSITYVGVMLSVFILCCEFFLFAIDFFSSNQYLSRSFNLCSFAAFSYHWAYFDPSGGKFKTYPDPSWFR